MGDKMGQYTGKVKIKTRATGSYMGLFLAPNGRWRSAGTYGDRAVARAAAMSAYDRSRDGSWVDPLGAKGTFRNLAEVGWMKTRTGKEATTRDADRSTLDNHLLPFFGEMPLGEIKPSVIGEWIGVMQGKGLAPATIHRAHAVLTSIFSLAVKDGMLPHNPATLARSWLPTIPEHEVRILTREEFDRFLDAVPDEQMLYVLVMISTGMRASEMRGFCPRQIDREQSAVRIDRGVVRVDPGKNDGQQWVVKPYTKGRKPRVVPLDEDLIKELLAAVLARGLSMDSEDPIFVRPDGGYVSGYFAWSMIKAALAAAELPKDLSQKHLRSSYCSWLFDGGTNPLVIKELMGHKDLSTTMLYSKAMPETIKKTAQTFAGLGRNRRRTAS